MSHLRSAGTALFFAAGLALASDVVVLRGGARIELKQPWVQQGNNVLLTRTDGTLLSVPASEIDARATAEARARKPEPARPPIVAPPSTPADAVRSGREPRARVRVTDADVGHSSMALSDGADKDKGEVKGGAARVEVGEYTQQKAGTNLLITGNLRNTGTEAVTGTRLTVYGVDDAGNSVTSANATMAGGTIDGNGTVNFSVNLPVGDRKINHFRFTPTWTAPPAPAPAAAVAAAAAAANAAAASAAAPAPAAPNAPPGPRPTPYGQGSLYAAPAGSAPSTAPADGKTGYIPGAANPDQQPKPPQ